MKDSNRRLWSTAVSLALVMIILTIWAPHVAGSSSTTAIITAIYYDTYLTGEPDEAFRLTNISGLLIDLANWTATDGEGTITLSDTLPAGASIWIAEEADAFALEFGFPPNYEYGTDTDPAVPNLATSGNFALANTGDELVLEDDTSAIVDQVVYEGGDSTDTGWTGPGVEPYSGDTVGIERFAQGEREVEGFGVEGQVLYRKLDQETGLPVADTDTAADWAQATDDDINGKKVLYPGWDLERYFFTETFTETATLTYVVAPDHIYETVLAEINQATTSIYYEGYTFNNAHLADAIVARMTANPGMTVTILLEGGPVGGIGDQEKWICQQIENAGGQVYFMYNDDPNDVHDRYTYQHGKWMIIDEQRLLTGSENLNYSSMPADDKADGTKGNRGVWLITDAPSAVAHALDVFRHDLDPEHHRDIFRWTAGHPIYGAPPPGFVPDYSSGGNSYQVRFLTPLTTSGTFFFEMVQSPENSLRDVDSLLGMVARAGNGDTVLVEQLYEYTYWGPTASNPMNDPNPRLEGYVDAARRGVRVRMLLDSAWDDPGDVRGNSATCVYVNGIAAAESLNLACKLANPAGTGIHNKMVLVWANGQGYVHTGSINGSENSSKGNREFAAQVQSDAAYGYLADVFWYDYGEPQEYFVHLPLLLRNYPPPPNQPTLYAIDNADGDGSYTISWTELPKRLADTYTLEEATNSTFTSGLRVVCTTADQSCPVSGRLAGTYYYRVRGHNAVGDSPYSNVQSVSVLLPETPSLNAIDNVDGDGNYTVSWSAAARAASYTLQEDTVSDFAQPTTRYSGAGLSTSITSQPVGVYYYRVKAIGSTGQSDWSNVRSVTVSPESESDLYIQSLIYDSRDERLVIHNRGTGPQNMTGWWIHSVVGNQKFYFPDDYTLAADATVCIHTGPDAFDNPPLDLLWTTLYIWNNDGDEAVLYDNAGQLVDSYSY